MAIRLLSRLFSLTWCYVRSDYTAFHSSSITLKFKEAKYNTSAQHWSSCWLYGTAKRASAFSGGAAVGRFSIDCRLQHTLSMYWTIHPIHSIRRDLYHEHINNSYPRALEQRQASCLENSDSAKRYLGYSCQAAACGQDTRTSVIRVGNRQQTEACDLRVRDLFHGNQVS